MPEAPCRAIEARHLVWPPEAHRGHAMAAEFELTVKLALGHDGAGLPAQTS
jgi:hypothetical protein